MDEAQEEMLIGRIVKALEPYDIPTGRGWRDAERREPAERILEALGLEFVGWGGAKREDARWVHGANDPDERPDVDLKDGEVLVWMADDREWMVTEPGLWYLRMEDGSDDLIDPWPVYRLGVQSDA